MTGVSLTSPRLTVYDSLGIVKVLELLQLNSACSLAEIESRVVFSGMENALEMSIL
jgi:hypothetical protein